MSFFKAGQNTGSALLYAAETWALEVLLASCDQKTWNVEIHVKSKMAGQDYCDGIQRKIPLQAVFNATFIDIL